MKKVLVSALCMATFAAMATEPVPAKLGLFRIGMDKEDLVKVLPAMPCHKLTNDFTCSHISSNKWKYDNKKGVEVWSLGPMKPCADLTDGGNCILRFKDDRLVAVTLVGPKETKESLTTMYGKPETFDNQSDQRCGDSNTGVLNRLGFLNHAWGAKEDVRVNWGTLKTQGKTCDTFNTVNIMSLFDFKANAEVTNILWSTGVNKK